MGKSPLLMEHIPLRKQNVIFLLLLVTNLLSGFGFAESLLPGLEPLRVGDRSQTCLGYRSVQGKTFCITRPDSTPVELGLASVYEPMNLYFDNRQWEIGWWNQKTRQPLFHYVLKGQTVNNWSELLTVQFYPKPAPDRINLKKLAYEQTMFLQRLGFQPHLQLIAESPNDILYEFQVEGAGSQNEQSLIRIIRGEKGIYQVNYDSRPTMSRKHRTTWIQLLSQATIKPGFGSTQR
jgi:hypothetical protein